jgi:putative inorganic carbon (HCO3(-)) transporter
VAESVQTLSSHGAWIPKLVRAIVALEPLLLVMAAPFLLFPRAKWTPAMLVVPLIWLARYVGHGRVIRRTPLDWAILLMMVMVLVSLYATFDIAFSLPKIAGMVLAVAVYYAVIEYADSPRHLWIATGVFLLTGLALSVVGLLGVAWSSKFEFLTALTSRLPRLITGLPGAESGLSGNELAGALEWIVLPAWTMVVWMAWQPSVRLRPGARRRVVLALGLVAAMTTGTLVLTQSRGGIIGMATGMLLLLLMAGRRWQLIVWGVAVVVVIVTVWLGPARVWDAVTNEGTALTTVAGRLEVWSRALYGIQDFPFTGMGMNTFRRIVPVLYPLFMVSPDVDIAHAHNHLLQAALDLGIPGLIAYLALWLLAIVMSVQIWRSRAPDGQRVLALGISAGLLAYFVYGFTDVVTLGSKPGVVWWWLLALLTADWRLAQEKQATCSSPVV